MFTFELQHGGVGQFALLCRARVTLDLFQTPMTANGPDLVRHRATLCQTRCGGLPQTMRRAMRRPAFIAPFAKLVAKPGRRDRTAIGSRQNGEVVGWSGVNDLLPIRVKRYVEIDGIAIFILHLPVPNASITKMLGASISCCNSEGELGLSTDDRNAISADGLL